MFAHQDFDVILGKGDGSWGTQVDKFATFSPIVLCVRIPIHGQLEYLKHREGTLFLQFIIDVEKCTYKPIIGH